MTPLDRLPEAVQFATVPLLNARLVEGAENLIDGFAVRPSDEAVRTMQAPQGFPPALSDHAILTYQGLGSGLVCFDSAFIQRAELLLALIELKLQARLWYPFIEAEARMDAGPNPDSYFRIGSTAILPSAGDFQRPPDDMVELYADDLAAVAHAYGNLRKDLKAERRARLAILRWSRARRRSADEDAVIDAWIGLEALYCDDIESIRVEAAARIAQYIVMGTDGSGRTAVAFDLTRSLAFKWAYQAYGVRSRIVHGDLVQGKGLEIARGRSEELLESTLRSLVFGGELSGLRGRQLQDAFYATI